MQVRNLIGVWRRSLLIEADGSRDTTTEVTWLQGASAYIDLRTPKTTVSFANVGSLRDLEAEQIEALSLREGFAGHLIAHPDHFEWMRTIDVQPPQRHSDRGRLSDQGCVMIEEGYTSPYIEHWHRALIKDLSTAALSLVDDDGCQAMIVRVDTLFGFARGRTTSLQRFRHLLDLVRQASSLEAAQDLIDCEISMGSTIDGWRISKSTLPYRVGIDLMPRNVDRTLTTEDVTAEGRAYRRKWTITNDSATELRRFAGDA